MPTTKTCLIRVVRRAGFAVAGESNDSRSFGPVAFAAITGRVASSLDR